MVPSRLLLDTHVVLWSLDGINLTARTRDIMGKADELLCSAATVWEISIQAKKGNITLPPTWLNTIVTSGIRLLDLTAEHAYTTGAIDLPHGDPFDRLLVAQAMSEQLGLLTADETLLKTAYPFILKA